MAPAIYASVRRNFRAKPLFRGVAAVAGGFPPACTVPDRAGAVRNPARNALPALRLARAVGLARRLQDADTVTRVATQELPT